MLWAEGDRKVKVKCKERPGYGHPGGRPKGLRVAWLAVGVTAPHHAPEPSVKLIEVTDQVLS